MALSVAERSIVRRAGTVHSKTLRFTERTPVYQPVPSFRGRRLDRVTLHTGRPERVRWRRDARSPCPVSGPEEERKGVGVR